MKKLFFLAFFAVVMNLTAEAQLVLNWKVVNNTGNDWATTIIDGNGVSEDLAAPNNSTTFGNGINNFAYSVRLSGGGGGCQAGAIIGGLGNGTAMTICGGGGAATVTWEVLQTGLLEHFLTVTIN